MPTSQYLEALSSQIPALQLLINMGYQYLSPEEANVMRGGRRSKVVLEGVLEKQLTKLNQITFKNKAYDFSDANIRKAVLELTNIQLEGLIHTNESVYDLITLGKSLEQTIAGYTRSFSLKYIDWPGA